MIDILKKHAYFLKKIYFIFSADFLSIFESNVQPKIKRPESKTKKNPVSSAKLHIALYLFRTL